MKQDYDKFFCETPCNTIDNIVVLFIFQAIWQVKSDNCQVRLHSFGYKSTGVSNGRAVRFAK